MRLALLALLLSLSHSLPLSNDVSAAYLDSAAAPDAPMSLTRSARRLLSLNDRHPVSAAFLDDADSAVKNRMGRNLLSLKGSHQLPEAFLDNSIIPKRRGRVLHSVNDRNVASAAFLHDAVAAPKRRGRMLLGYNDKNVVSAAFLDAPVVTGRTGRRLMSLNDRTATSAAFLDEAESAGRSRRLRGKPQAMRKRKEDAIEGRVKASVIHLPHPGRR